eukprot:5804902-Amphidinium_carterae.1
MVEALAWKISCSCRWQSPQPSQDPTGRITLGDFQGNQVADVVANLGASAHAVHEPSAEYLRWTLVAQA